MRGARAFEVVGGSSSLSSTSFAPFYETALGQRRVMRAKESQRKLGV